MADELIYKVYGAGLKPVDANYIQYGDDYNGKPAFLSISNLYWMWYNNLGGYYVISVNKGDYVTDYLYTSVGSNPSGSWDVAIGSVSPAPTVTLIRGPGITVTPPSVTLRFGPSVVGPGNSIADYAQGCALQLPDDWEGNFAEQGEPRLHPDGHVYADNGRYVFNAEQWSEFKFGNGDNPKIFFLGNGTGNIVEGNDWGAPTLLWSDRAVPAWTMGNNLTFEEYKPTVFFLAQVNYDTRFGAPPLNFTMTMDFGDDETATTTGIIQQDGTAFVGQGFTNFTHIFSHTYESLPTKTPTLIVHYDAWEPQYRCFMPQPVMVAKPTVNGSSILIDLRGTYSLWSSGGSPDDLHFSMVVYDANGKYAAVPGYGGKIPQPRLDLDPDGWIWETVIANKGNPEQEGDTEEIVQPISIIVIAGGIDGQFINPEGDVEYCADAFDAALSKTQSTRAVHAAGYDITKPNASGVGSSGWYQLRYPPTAFAGLTIIVNTTDDAVPSACEDHDGVMYTTLMQQDENGRWVEIRKFKSDINHPYVLTQLQNEGYGIIYHDMDSSALYVITQNLETKGYSIRKSTNYGTTWGEPMALPFGSDFKSVRGHSMQDGGHVAVGVKTDGSVWFTRSNDGQNWKPLVYVTTNTDIKGADVYQMNLSGSTKIVITDGSSFMMGSSDYGATWQPAEVG